MRKLYFHSSMGLHNVALNSAQANFTLYRTKVYTTMENRHVHTHTHTHNAKIKQFQFTLQSSQNISTTASNNLGYDRIHSDKKRLFQSQ